MHEDAEDEEDEVERAATPVETDGDQVGDDEVAGGADGGEVMAEEEHERQRATRRPEAPTKEEIAEHNLSHIPMRPWCKHCMRGKGKRRPSLGS